MSNADALEFPFTTPPEFGATIEVAPGIKWLRMPLPMSLNHINLYLVDTGEGWLIVDTGMKGDDVQKYWQQKEVLKFVILTRLIMRQRKKKEV
jgi:glyoxylase-like metal-dependent hydrolase (beta-lactamase superfamily II)